MTKSWGSFDKALLFLLVLVVVAVLLFYVKSRAFLGLLSLSFPWEMNGVCMSSNGIILEIQGVEPWETTIKMIHLGWH